METFPGGRYSYGLHSIIRTRKGIPASLGHLQLTTGIQLKNCNLTGNIPESFGDLPKCGNLQLNNNKLSGVVPAAVQAHAKWGATTGWKYETNILPQQDGYGLKLQ